MLLSSRVKYPNFFLIFTYNPANVSWFYLLSGGQMYTWSPVAVAPPPSDDVGETPGYLCFKDYNDGVPTFRNCPVKLYTVH